MANEIVVRALEKELSVMAENIRGTLVDVGQLGLHKFSDKPYYQRASDAIDRLHAAQDAYDAVADELAKAKTGAP